MNASPDRRPTCLTVDMADTLAPRQFGAFYKFIQNPGGFDVEHRSVYLRGGGGVGCDGGVIIPPEKDLLVFNTSHMMPPGEFFEPIWASIQKEVRAPFTIFLQNVGCEFRGPCQSAESVGRCDTFKPDTSQNAPSTYVAGVPCSKANLLLVLTDIRRRLGLKSPAGPG